MTRRAKTLVCFDGVPRSFDPEYIVCATYRKSQYQPIVRIFLDARTPNGLFRVDVPVSPAMTPDEALRWIAESCGCETISVQSDAYHR